MEHDGPAAEAELRELRARAFGRNATDEDVERLLAVEAAVERSERSRPVRVPPQEPDPDREVAADDDVMPVPARIGSPARIGPPARSRRRSVWPVGAAAALIAVLSGSAGWALHSGSGAGPGAYPTSAAAARAAATREPGAVTVSCFLGRADAKPAAVLAFPLSGPDASAALDDPRATCAKQVASDSPFRIAMAEISRLVDGGSRCGEVVIGPGADAPRWWFHGTGSPSEVSTTQDAGAAGPCDAPPVMLPAVAPAFAPSVVCGWYGPVESVVGGTSDVTACASVPPGHS